MNEFGVGEAKSRFSELISRAAGGERFMIRRRGRPVAVVLGRTDLDRLERASRRARSLAEALGQSDEILREIESGETHPAMAAFGLWRDEEELATLTEEIRTHRARQTGRPVPEL